MKIKLPFVPRRLQQQVRRQVAEWISNPTVLDMLGEEGGDVSIKDTGYPARVLRITRQTSRAVTVELVLEGGYRLNYRAGQSICVSFQLGNSLFRRTFSLSSCPEENRIAFTAKSILHGRISSFIAEKLKIGERVIIEDPQGDFVLPTEKPYEQRYVMLAAGSGIVPIFSMIKDLLGKNALADITLVYCNRTTDEVLFRRDIESLEHKHSGFKVHWHYTRREGYGHDHSRRLNGEKVLALIADAAQAFYYVCAPVGLASSFLDALNAIGIPESAVKFELFSAPAHVTEDAELQPRRVVFENPGLLGGSVSVDQKQVETLLDTASRAGIKISQHCTVGNCKACKVKVLQGTAVMDEPNSLSTDEALAGYVLACVAYPCEDVVVQLPRKQ